MNKLIKKKNRSQKYNHFHELQEQEIPTYKCSWNASKLIIFLPRNQNLRLRFSSTYTATAKDRAISKFPYTQRIYQIKVEPTKQNAIIWTKKGENHISKAMFFPEPKK